jgi:prepilin-type N-terminal cleavage/methylation domain-containing protein
MTSPTFPEPAPSHDCSRRARGFTLIEILIVVVVIGILAGLAIPRFSRAKEKALVAAMIADLHAAGYYEELYATEHGGSYFSGTATPTTAVEGFETTKDVTVTLTALAPVPTPGGSLRSWTAVARHAGTDKRCEMTSGLVTCTTREDWTTGEISKN